MLVELLRHGGVDLTRRWVGALLLVPPDERPSIVEAVERQVVSMYASNDADDVPISRDAPEPAAPIVKPKAQRLPPAPEPTPNPEPEPDTRPRSIIESKPTPKRRGGK